MGRHDHVTLFHLDDSIIGNQLFARPGFGNIDKPLVRIGGGAPVAGEVFDGGEDAAAVQGINNRNRLPGNDRRVGRKAPLQSPDHGIVRIGIQIHDGGEVQVYSQTGQCFSRLIRGLLRCLNIVQGSEMLRRHGRREPELFLQTTYPAPLLIDRDKERNRSGTLQGGHQLFHLPGRFDIPDGGGRRDVVIEEDDAPDPPLSDIPNDGGPFIHLEASEPDHQHLPDLRPDIRLRGIRRGRGGDHHPKTRDDGTQHRQKNQFFTFVPEHGSSHTNFPSPCTTGRTIISCRGMP